MSVVSTVQRGAPPTVSAQTIGTKTTITALPVTVDLNIYAGDDFSFTVTVTNADGSTPNLTGQTAKAEVRVTPGDATALVTFTCTIATNVITLTLPHTASTGLPAATVYDCQLTDSGGAITTLIAGKITSTADVTK